MHWIVNALPLLCLPCVSSNMADHLPKMDWGAAHIPSAFKLFKQRCELYFKIKKIEGESAVTHILLAVGEEGLRRYNTWKLSPEDLKSPKAIWDKFEAQIEPTESFRICRLKLSHFKQNPNESLDDFTTRAKAVALKCDFSDTELDERLVELIIAGTPIPEFQKELLTMKKDYKLEEALALGRTYEATISHVKELQQLDSSSVDTVHRKNNNFRNRRFDRSKSRNRNNQWNCRNCGTKHLPRQCPAYKDTCDGCGNKGHWVNFCRLTNRANNHKKHYDSRHPRHSHGSKDRRSSRKVDEIKQAEASCLSNMEEQFESFTFSEITVSSLCLMDKRDEAFVTMNIEISNQKHKLQLKVDTGAQANTLPLHTYRKMFPTRLDSHGFPCKGTLKETTCALSAYNGSKITCCGITTIPMAYQNTGWRDTDFFVVDVPGPAVLGLPSCTSLNVVKLNCSIQSEQTPQNKKPKINSVDDLKLLYPDQFDRIGEFKTVHKLKVDPNVPPNVDPPRRVPLALKPKLKAELDSMVSSGVIRRIEEPTEWVSSIVCVTKKDGSLRVCLDPKHLNRALIRPRHRIPTQEELNHNFHKSKVFSKMDAKSGYWSVKLDEESQKLTTFQTPFGRYCYRRLPMGLSVSQDIFQLEMDRILEQCQGVCGISDDCVIEGTNDDNHDENLIHFMEVAKENGLVFNSLKCEIKKPSVAFFGNIYSVTGMKPDPQKIKDLQAMPTPSSKEELQQFLGVMTYLSHFIKDFSTKAATLRELLRKDSDFIWEPHHQSTFEDLKREVTETSNLQYFNPDAKAYLHCDASLKGIGAALLQSSPEGLKPIAFASKSLTVTEQRYACIERELLAIVFGVQRFHHYLFGRTFTVFTDHKPLVMIVDKPLSSAPPRLQRMLLKLQDYNFNIQYLPGKENTLADGLSRLPNASNSETIDLDVRVDLVRFSTEYLDDLRCETSQDTNLHHLAQVIVSGWPESIRDLPESLRPYWCYRDELSIDNGLILKGSRIVIPKSRHEAVMERLHYGHFGAEKTKLLARQTVYWPNINKLIDNVTAGCKLCQEFLNAQPSEPLQQHDIPPGPWHTLATDLFHFDDSEYLLIGDMYTKFPFVRKMPTLCPSRTVIAATKQIFGEHGIPENVISDGGPHFISRDYKQFAEQYGFNHIDVSPRYPKSNGFIERMVQTVKKIMLKAKNDKRDPELALLHWRITPVNHKIRSPAELLYNRKLRTLIPAKLRLQNESSDKDDIYNQLVQRRTTQKLYHDHRALPSSLPQLHPDQPVRVRNHNTHRWEPAVVVHKAPQPRSYVVQQSSNGRQLRRNRRDIRPVPVTSLQPAVTIAPDTSTSSNDTRQATPAVLPEPEPLAANDTPAPSRTADSSIPASPPKKLSVSFANPIRKSARVSKAPDRLTL